MSNYYTTPAGLASALALYKMDYQVLFAVGRTCRLTVPALIVYGRVMTLDMRSNWFDAHVDETNTVCSVCCVCEGAEFLPPWTVEQFVSLLNFSNDPFLACEVGAYKAAPVRIVNVDQVARTVTLAETTRAAV